MHFTKFILKLTKQLYKQGELREKIITVAILALSFNSWAVTTTMPKDFQFIEGINTVTTGTLTSIDLSKIIAKSLEYYNCSNSINTDTSDIFLTFSNVTYKASKTAQYDVDGDGPKEDVWEIRLGLRKRCRLRKPKGL